MSRKTSGRHRPGPPEMQYCSFCGKPADEVDLIPSPKGACICSECVEVCSTILGFDTTHEPV